jgi:hypothetical protein
MKRIRKELGLCTILLQRKIIYDAKRFSLGMPLSLVKNSISMHPPFYKQMTYNYATTKKEAKAPPEKFYSIKE